MHAQLLTIVELPEVSDTFLRWAAPGVLLLLVAAILLELIRQATARKRRLIAIWRRFDTITKDRELSQAEMRLLGAFIKRWAPQEPVHTITVRQEFDRCIEQEMDRLAARDDPDLFEERGVTWRDIRAKLALDYIPLGQQIVSTRELYQGQVLWLAPDTGKTADWFRGTVTEVDEARFVVEPPEGGGAPLPSYTPGEDIRCRMWREEDARYAFTAPYCGKETDPPALLFGHIGDLKRLQSRAYFRVRHDQALFVGVVDGSTEDGVDELGERRIVTRIRGRTTNLSVGGLAAALQQPASKQAFLRIMLELDETPPFPVFARIVATNSLSGGRCLVRAAFVAVSSESRDRIERYVMRCQQPLGDQAQVD